MDALENVRIGMTAEKTVAVTYEMTVGHSRRTCRRFMPRQ